MLRVAFARWVVETCFRTPKEELGMDHFEVRGWRCVHRHWYVTQLSYLFCSRLRVQYDDNEVALTVEQVRSVVNVWIRSVDFQPPDKRPLLEQEIVKQQYHQKRNAKARKSQAKKNFFSVAELATPCVRSLKLRLLGWLFFSEFERGIRLLLSERRVKSGPRTTPWS